jgi:hypothetical protein
MSVPPVFHESYPPQSELRALTITSAAGARTTIASDRSRKGNKMSLRMQLYRPSAAFAMMLR